VTSTFLRNIYFSKNADFSFSFCFTTIFKEINFTTIFFHAHMLVLRILIWFLSSGEAHSIKVEKKLYEEKSDFQEVLVFEV